MSNFDTFCPLWCSNLSYYYRIGTLQKYLENILIQGKLKFFIFNNLLDRQQNIMYDSFESWNLFWHFSSVFLAYSVKQKCSISWELKIIPRLTSRIFWNLSVPFDALLKIKCIRWKFWFYKGPGFNFDVLRKMQFMHHHQYWSI